MHACLYPTKGYNADPHCPNEPARTEGPPVHAPHMRRKLKTWIEGVNKDGLEAVRKTRGFHDEPLKGKRKGQRSIRLSRSYRAIYKVLSDGTLWFAQLEEVTKHGY